MKKPHYPAKFTTAQTHFLTEALMESFPTNPIARGRAFHAPHIEALVKTSVEKANADIHLSNQTQRKIYAARARKQRDQVNRAKRVSTLPKADLHSVPNKPAAPVSSVQRGGVKPSKSVGKGTDKQLGRSKGNKTASRRSSK